MNHPSPELLSGLLDKYRRLHRLRTEPAVLAPREELRRLARRWPGSLRELDRLPLEALEARVGALEAVLEGGREVEGWMRLQVSYHGFMRAALRVKRWSRDWPEDPSDVQRMLGERYVAAADEPAISFFDAGTIAAIRRPEGGRLNPLVLGAVAGLHGVGVEEVIGALF
jgi:hypothetical protein